MRSGIWNTAIPIVPREGRGGRADYEAKVWMAARARVAPRRRSKITVLFVSSFEGDHAALLSILKMPEFRLLRTRGVRQAMAALERRNIGVIIAECKLKGCCWKDTWMALQQIVWRPLPRLIVAASSGDEHLWNEVVRLGAYDVLAKPFECSEVLSVVTDAWEQWRRDTEVANAGV